MQVKNGLTSRLGLMIHLGGVLRCILMGYYLVCVSMVGGAILGWFLWWERR